MNQMRIFNKIVFILLMGIKAQAVFANEASLDSIRHDTVKHFAYVETLSIGPTWASSGQTQTFYLQPTIQKTYTSNNNTSTLADGELFLGVQRVISTALEGQIGLAIATTGDIKLSGNIWDDANPAFNNFDYAYKVIHTHIAIKGKLLREIGYAFKPFIQGSLGVGFNKAYDFSLTPTIFEALATPGFQSNTTTAFTYTLGIGLQRAITPNWQVGMAYEFADWGQSQLARAASQTMGTGLTLNHLYTNGLLFNISHLS